MSLTRKTWRTLIGSSGALTGSSARVGCIDEAPAAPPRQAKQDRPAANALLPSLMLQVHGGGQGSGLVRAGGGAQGVGLLCGADAPAAGRAQRRKV